MIGSFLTSGEFLLTVKNNTQQIKDSLIEEEAPTQINVYNAWSSTFFRGLQMQNVRVGISLQGQARRLHLSTPPRCDGDGGGDSGVT